MPFKNKETELEVPATETEMKPKTKTKSKEMKGFILADVIELEKKYTGVKDAHDNDEYVLNEGKPLGRVKILKEHLPIHASQEVNTLKRYREAE